MSKKNIRILTFQKKDGMLKQKGVGVLERKNEKQQTKEFSVQLENVNFQILIVLPFYSNGERPLHETLMHKHVFHELFVCTKGEISIKTPDGNILLKTGDIAIIPPAKTHVLQYSGHDTKGCTIPFLLRRNGVEHSVDLYKKISRIAGEETHIFRDHLKFVQEIEKIIDESFQEKTEKFLPALHLLELFLKLAKERNENIETEKTQKKCEAVSNDIERMMHLDGLIATRYRQKCSGAELAKELFISTRQLDRIVTKRYGKSLHQLLVDRRFELAEQLLETTELTVEAVAANSGFSSSASLYREFKKRRGSTPAAFRKK